MDGNLIKKDNVIVYAFIVFEILFFIFAGITISNIFKQEVEVAKMEVIDFSALMNNKILTKDNELVDSKEFILSDVRKNVIEGALYDTVFLNNNDSVLNNNVKIREESVHNIYVEDFEMYFLSFIVDIENLQQSYQVVYRWSDKDPNINVPVNTPILVFCPREEDLIYGDFNCKDKYNHYGEDLAVYSLLKNKMFDGFFVTLFGDVFNGDALEKIYISLVVNNEENRIEAEETLRKWLANFGFSLDDFNYEFSPYDWT